MYYNNKTYNQGYPYVGEPMNFRGMPVPETTMVDNRGMAPYGNDERFGGFFVPFLLGGLTGGAAVAVSRPRPVYVNPAPYPYYPGPYYGPRPY